VYFVSLLRLQEQWRSIVLSLSVCLSTRISPEPHAWSLPVFLCTLPMAVARSSSGRVTKSQGEGADLGVSTPLTIHCNVFTAKGIIWLPIRSCSRRDHSVTAAFTADGIGREGGDGSAQHWRTVMYDYLVCYVVCLCFLLLNMNVEVDVITIYHNLICIKTSHVRITFLNTDVLLNSKLWKTIFFDSYIFKKLFWHVQCLFRARRLSLSVGYCSPFSSYRPPVIQTDTH